MTLPLEPEQTEEVMIDETMRSALISMYGEEFPLLKLQPEEEDWVKWAKSLWDRHSAGIQNRLHIIQRNRLYREGVQWVSSVGLGPWREPPKPRDAARIVDNMIAPALDQRLQVISEQRPGFHARPASQDIDDVKKAEAKQVGLEYQYDQQDMVEITREACFWNGTDGVSFLELYWDPDAGPWHEMYGIDKATGQEMPLGQDGQPSPNGQAYKFPLGEVKTRVRRIEQVRVSADATATKKPWYWVIQDILPKAQAVREYGMKVSADVERKAERDDEYSMSRLNPSRLGYVLPQADELHKDQETVARYIVYCERSEYLPKGLMLVVIGDKVLQQTSLLPGVCPMVRWPDGSSNPAFYPPAIMETWIDAQLRVNAVKSKWVENIRQNAGTKILAKENAIVGETLLGATNTVISVKGLGGLTENVKFLEGMSLASDAVAFLDKEKKVFEDISGWNDVSRGQFSSEQSGRAILAIREQLERVFAPPVSASAKALTEWAKITCAWMSWGYDMPRTVAVIGKGRPDLARELSNQDFDGVVDVWIDPETLMPMPRALKLFLLKDLYQMQVMDAKEYRRRLPFANIGTMSSYDEDHEARARRVCEGMRNGQELPILWMDNEPIHMDVIERELILPDDIPPQIRGMAFNRWLMLAQQLQMKMGGMVPPPTPTPQGAPQGGAMSPTTQPLPGTNPSIAAGTTDQLGAARAFDTQIGNKY